MLWEWGGGWEREGHADYKSEREIKRSIDMSRYRVIESVLACKKERKSKIKVEKWVQGMREREREREQD